MFKIIKICLSNIYKLYKNIRVELKEFFYPEKSNFIFQQNSFHKVGIFIERENNLKHLNQCLKSINFPLYDESNGMYSEHLLIFSAISKGVNSPKNILEIGTYDGKTSVILSSLFPDSKVTTIDLSDKDPIFKNIYGRENSHQIFIKKRNHLISNYKNIEFIQGNSLFLTLNDYVKKQDLIWVDGAHGYPIVCSDITNCIRLLNKGGILMCDDISKLTKRNDPIYSSVAGFKSLESFNKANILKTNYFLKRLGKHYNLKSRYISFSKIKTDVEYPF